MASQGNRGGLRASLDAARALEVPEERESALMEVGWRALETAPDLAAEVIREMPHESADAARLIQACVTHLMKNSPDEASVWADSLKDAPWIALAREQIAMIVAESDPKRAIQLAGYDSSMADELIHDMRAQILIHEAVATEVTEHGQYFEIACPLAGPNGRILDIRTIWMREHLSGQMKFITLIPAKKR